MIDRSNTSRKLHLHPHDMRILIHDFSGHPFQVHLSRNLAQKGYTVLHVYSKSFQTPKGSLQKKDNDSENFDVIGILQTKPFPKYSFIKRWFAENEYAKALLKIARNFKPHIVISSNAPLDIQKHLYRQCEDQNTRFIFWVQDIYSIGIQQVLKKKLPVIGGIISLYYRNLEKTIMKNSEQIVVIADEFKSVIQEWASGKKITTIENWAPLDEIRPQPKKNHWSVSQGISDKFCFLYSGTLGMKHNPEILLKLAMHYQHDKDTIIVIISEGIGVEWLKVEVAKQKLKNVRFYNYFDFEMFPFVLSSADVLIAILEKSAGIFSVPSKVLSYHCIGRPLLLSIPNDNLASRIVRSQQSGFAHDSEDMDGFILSADTLKKDLNLRFEMGKNARDYAEHEFNIDNKCDSFINIFNKGG